MATIFSSFLNYVGVTSTLPSTGLAVGGFMFGPIMLDYYFRGEQASCNIDGIDYAAKLRHFLLIEGTLLTVSWVFIICFVLIHHVFPGRARGEEQVLLQRKDDRENENQTLIEVALFDDANSNFRGGGLNHFGFGPIGEAAVVMGSILIFAVIGVGCCMATYWVWGPGKACTLVMSGLWKHCERVLTAHWVITCILVVLVPIVMYNKTCFPSESEDFEKNLAEQKRKLDRPNWQHNVQERKTAVGIDAVLHDAGTKLCAVLFYSDDSEPCQALKHVFEECSQEFPQFVFVRMDVETHEGRKAVAELKIGKLPTVLFFVECQVTERLDGALAGEEFLRRKLLEQKVLADL